ncbi:MAG: ethylbenzene dehydrogenase-related protein, partial [Xanthomonadaceae bacterium]|nr:ethylbenzene dehydrogenase-related protein [Xanthomonadaceae bacterium]
LDQLQQWAALPLGLEPTLTPDPARFEFLLSDDLANLNTDVYLHISENILDNIDGEGQPRFDSITLRIMGKSVESLGLGEIPGSEDPLWLEPGNEAPPLSTFAPVTGVPVAINDLAVTLEDELVNVNVLANDLLDGALVDPTLAEVNIVSAPANGTAEVVLANQTIDYTPAAGFTGDDTFTYTVTIMGEISNLATVKVTVNPSPIPDAPIAANDSAVTFQATPVAINVLANDTISGGPIPAGAVLEVVDSPVNGLATATVVGDQIVYDPRDTPPETIDVFTYRVTVDGVPSNLALVLVRVDDNADQIFADGFEGEGSVVFAPDVSRVGEDIEIALRAAQDANRLALQFSWPTNKNYAGLLHDLRALDGTGEWVTPLANISGDDPNRVNEDRVSIIFGTENGGALGLESEYFGCFQSCHADMNGMPQATVDARHYVLPLDAGQIGTYQSDMWHWRGSRSGPMGFAEDTWVRSHDFGTGGQGRQRDAIGPDGNLRNNQSFDTEHNVTVEGQTLTVKLPSLVYDPGLNSGFYFLNDGAQLITEDTIGNLFSSQTIGKMEAGTLQHQLITNGDLANAIAVANLDAAARDEVARQALAGGVINRPFLNDDTVGTSDQHDIRSLRRFSNERWTVTLIRELDTQSDFDTDLSMLDLQNYPMAFAVHDSNDGGFSHQVSIPLTLGAAGDIEPTVVDNIDDVNWLGIQPLVTTLFKPGNNMSFEWLNDNPAGHPVAVDATCSSCHFLASVDHPNGARPPGSCLGCHTGGGRAALVWEYAPLEQ